MEKERKSASVDSVDEAIDDSVRMLGCSTVFEKQRLSIRKFLDGNDVFVNLPTEF